MQSLIQFFLNREKTEKRQKGVNRKKGIWGQFV